MNAKTKNILRTLLYGDLYDPQVLENLKKELENIYTVLPDFIQLFDLNTAVHFTRFRKLYLEGDYRSAFDYFGKHIYPAVVEKLF